MTNSARTASFRPERHFPANNFFPSVRIYFWADPFKLNLCKVFGGEASFFFPQGQEIFCADDSGIIIAKDHR
jgi:hypothetical protein